MTIPIRIRTNRGEKRGGGGGGACTQALIFGPEGGVHRRECRGVPALGDIWALDSLTEVYNWPLK